MTLDYLFHFLLFLGLGAVGAILATRLKLPTAVFIGPIVIVGLYQIAFGSVIDKPNGLRFAVQIVVGIILGTSITKDFLNNFKLLLKPIVTVCLILFGGAFTIGLFLKNIAGWDLITSILASAPGGQAEMALLSDSVGAQTEKVIVLQLIRSQLVFVILLPLVKLYIDKQKMKIRVNEVYINDGKKEDE